MKVAVSGIAVTAALTAAAAAAGSHHTRPQPIAFTCKFEKGIAVLVEPRRRQTTIVDAGVTGDQYGNRIQSPESSRVVAIFNTRGPSFFVGCKRVAPARRARVSHLTGPWPARVFSRVLCPAGGPAVRFDAFPIAGGGYRFSIALRSGRGTQHALVSTEQRPRNRGGISFDTGMCFRLGK